MLALHEAEVQQAGSKHNKRRCTAVVSIYHRLVLLINGKQALFFITLSNWHLLSLARCACLLMKTSGCPSILGLLGHRQDACAERGFLGPYVAEKDPQSDP